MHSINLNNYNYRTDLIIEKDLDNCTNNSYNDNGILIDKREDNKKNKYVTITFDDITDKDNYKKVEKIFIKELKEVLGSIKDKKIMVIGLGNNKSTPDSLGPEVVDNILVTRHLFNLGEVEEGYSNVCSFKPNVTGVTGIETSKLITSLISFLQVDLVLIIDALAASSI